MCRPQPCAFGEGTPDGILPCPASQKRPMFVWDDAQINAIKKRKIDGGTANLQGVDGNRSNQRVPQLGKKKCEQVETQQRNVFLRRWQSLHPNGIMSGQSSNELVFTGKMNSTWDTLTAAPRTVARSALFCCFPVTTKQRHEKILSCHKTKSNIPDDEDGLMQAVSQKGADEKWNCPAIQKRPRFVLNDAQIRARKKTKIDRSTANLQGVDGNRSNQRLRQLREQTKKCEPVETPQRNVLLRRWQSLHPNGILSGQSSNELVSTGKMNSTWDAAPRTVARNALFRSFPVNTKQRHEKILSCHKTKSNNPDNESALMQAVSQKGSGKEWNNNQPNSTHFNYTIMSRRYHPVQCTNFPSTA